MKNEIMYDGITGIREDIVLQAENYQFDKKNCNKWRKDVWMKYGISAAKMAQRMLRLRKSLKAALEKKGVAL